MGPGPVPWVLPWSHPLHLFLDPVPAITSIFSNCTPSLSNSSWTNLKLKKKKNHLQVFLIWVFPCFIPRDTNHLIIEAWPGKLLWCQTPKSMPGSAVSRMAHGGCRFYRHTSFFFLLSSNPPPVPLSSLPLSVQFSCSVVSDTL